MLNRRRAAILEALGVLAFFTAVAVFATWPLALHPLGGFYGFGNDNWGGIPYLGWLHDAYLGPGDPSFDPELQTPFGLEIPGYALQPMDRLFSLLLGGFEQGLGAYNAQIFLSFVLAGCTMYLLARYVTGDRLAAALAGFAFTFSPFHLAAAMQYNALASIQWIPLYVLALLVLLRRGRPRDAVYTGAAFALVALTSYYYAWFVGWFTLLVVAYFAVAAAVRKRREGRPLLPAARSFLRLAVTRGALALGVTLLLAGPFLAVSARGAADAGTETLEHPLTEAVRYSARPWMFFVPPLDNPLVGEKVQPWVNQRLYDAPVYEQSIYLGYTLLILGIVGFWRSGRLGAPTEATLFARGLLAAGVVAGALIMLGPFIPLEPGYWQHWQTPDTTAHLPSLPKVMFDLAPVFRFFTRAFVLVSACLAVLAAIGLARIGHAPGMTTVRRVGLTAVAMLFLGLEFTNAPPHVWQSAEPPPWVAAARRLPAKAKIVDYPIAPAFSPRSLYYMFWQGKHRRWTENPAADPEAQVLASAILSPDDPEAGRALSRAGIEYAIVHTRLPPETTMPYQPGSADDSLPADAGSINPWLAVEERTADAIVYRVLRNPRASSQALVRATSGFGGLEPEGRFKARWLEAEKGELAVYVTGKRRRVRIRLAMSSFARPRTVKLTLDGREVDFFVATPVSYTTRIVDLGPLSVGRHIIEVAANPGPQSIREVTGTPDARSVSLRLREPLRIVGAG